jgi:hypothetical protein
MNGVLVRELISISLPMHTRVSTRNTFAYSTISRIIAGRTVALTWCKNFSSACTIMDGAHQCFVSSSFTDSRCSINSGADPLQNEVRRQMAPSAFAAAIAEYNDRNGSFDDE